MPDVETTRTRLPASHAEGTRPSVRREHPPRTAAVPIEQVRVRAYRIPTDAPEADGTIAWDSTSLVVVEVAAGDIVGTGWTYGPPACASLVQGLLAQTVRGRDALDVPGTWAAMVAAVRNATRRGAAGYAISAVDCALWDLKARLLGVPLADLLGRARRDVPVYGSGGFTSYSDDQARAQLERWVFGQGIPRVKIKIGESWGRRVDRDLRRVRLARRVVGADTALYVDANGGYTAKQAIRVGARLDGLGVTWFEEPVSSDHTEGLAQVRAAVGCDVTAGEYIADLFDARRLSPVVDCLQVDVTRCGGITEWLRVAAVAAAHGLEVSGHCAPNQHAAVAAAVPNLRHLEWFHDHVRIEDMLFDGVLDPTGGSVTPSDSPGHGMVLRRDTAEQFRQA